MNRETEGQYSRVEGGDPESPLKTPAFFTFSPSWRNASRSSSSSSSRQPSARTPRFGGSVRRTETTVIMSTYNLTSTILGAGILSIPFAFRESGILVGIAMLVITALLSNFSCGLVLSAYVWTSKASYGDIAGKLYGKRAQLSVEAIVMLLNVGACAAYMLVVKELMPPALTYLAPSAFGHASERLLTAILVFGVVLPLCCLKDISSLRFTSMLAFCFAIFLVVSVAVRSLQHMVSLREDGSDSVVCSVLWKSDGFIGIFRALPLFSFSYICHLNVLPVYEFLRSRSPSRMRKVFGLAMFFVTVLYVVVGAFGSLRFCDETPGNILGFPGGKDDNCGHFPKSDALVTVARLAQTLTCTLALPLITLPTRLALHSLLRSIFCGQHGEKSAVRAAATSNAAELPRHAAETTMVRAGNDEAWMSRRPHSVRKGLPRVSTDKMANLRQLGIVEAHKDPVDEDDEMRVESPSPPSSSSSSNRATPRTPMKDPLLSLRETNYDGGADVVGDDRATNLTRVLTSSRFVQCYESAAILGISYLLAITVPRVNVAFGLIGSTLCTIVVFILPALFYLGATATHASEVNTFSRLAVRRGLSRMLLVYGVVTGLAGTSVTVWQSFFVSDSDAC